MTALLGSVTLVTALGLGGVLWQWGHAVQGERHALPAQGVGGRCGARRAAGPTDGGRPHEPAHRRESPLGPVVLARFGPTTPKPVEPKLLGSLDPIDARRGIRNPDKLSAQTAQTLAPRLQNRGIASSNSTR
jgi:hypothetical protein